MTTLNQALDMAVQLPIDQQEMLIDILRHRQIEARRQEIAQSAQESILAYRMGQLKPQSAIDTIRELRDSLAEDEQEDRQAIS
jgi:uncharacterized protein (DUF305 family)